MGRVGGAILGVIFIIVILIWGITYLISAAIGGIVNTIHPSSESLTATTITQQNTPYFIGSAKGGNDTSGTTSLVVVQGFIVGVHLGPDGSIRFSDVVLPHSGEYYVTLYGEAAGLSHITFNVGVNGNKPIKVNFPGNNPDNYSDWVGLTFPIQFEKGTNKITISATNYNNDCFEDGLTTDFCDGSAIRWVIVHQLPDPVPPAQDICGATTNHLDCNTL
jgi:hypothetical protein